MSQKHRDSPGVKAAFKHLQNLQPDGLLRWVGEECDHKSSGSIQIWGSIAPGRQKGTIALIFIASTKIAYMVLSGDLLIATNNQVPPGAADFKCGLYMDTTSPTTKIEAAFNLSTGRHLTKEYDPANTTTLREGLESWYFKQQQYHLYIKIDSLRLP